MTGIARAFSRENRRLWLAGGAAFTIALIATTPAGVIAPLIASGAPQLVIGNAAGTVWRGSLDGVYFNEVPLGKVQFQIRPFSILTGHVAADLTIDGGALTGRGRAEIGAGSISLKGLAATFSLAAIRRYTFFGVPYQGTVRLTAKRISWSQKGCVASDATFSTDMLSAVVSRWTKEPFALEGPLTCADRRLTLDLNGSSPDGALSLTAALSGKLGYELSATAAPSRPELALLLRSFGFEGENSRMSMRASGQLKGLNS